MLIFSFKLREKGNARGNNRHGKVISSVKLYLRKLKATELFFCFKALPDLKQSYAVAKNDKKNKKHYPKGECVWITGGLQSNGR